MNKMDDLQFPSASDMRALSQDFNQRIDVVLKAQLSKISHIVKRAADAGEYKTTVIANGEMKSCMDHIVGALKGYGYEVYYNAITTILSISWQAT